MCTLHATSKRVPHNTRGSAVFLVVPCKITRVKMNLQLSGTVYSALITILLVNCIRYINSMYLAMYLCHCKEIPTLLVN